MAGRLTNPRFWARVRLGLVVVSVVLLVYGVLAGLQRLGWAIGGTAGRLAVHHGSVMVVMFFGALIALERAAALQKPWTYIPPILLALAGLLALVDAPMPLIKGIGFVGAVLFAGVAWVMVKHHAALYTQTMALGIVMFAIGTGWWALGRPMVRVVWWWVGYFVLTIAGERLELGRLTGAAQRKGHIFRWALVLTMLGLMLAEAYPDLGVRVYALGMLGLGGWLLRYDIAWFTIRRPGLPRFAAWCLLTGYVWLIFGALIVIVQGLQPGTFSYDAALHSVLLGFVFSMIFGHAPIIFPALLGLPIEFHPGLYVALAMLHISLIARVLGDVIGNADLRLWGGMFNAISMLVYFGWMAVRRAYQELRRRLAASG